MVEYGIDLYLGFDEEVQNNAAARDAARIVIPLADIQRMGGEEGGEERVIETLKSFGLRCARKQDVIDGVKVRAYLWMQVCINACSFLYVRMFYPYVVANFTFHFFKATFWKSPLLP